MRDFEELLVLFAPHHGRLRLPGVDLRDLGREVLDLLRELRLRGLGLLDAGHDLLELAAQVRLLPLRPTFFLTPS